MIANIDNNQRQAVTAKATAHTSEKQRALNALMDATRYAKFFVTSDRFYRAAAALKPLRRAPIIGNWLYWRALRAALTALTVRYAAPSTIAYVWEQMRLQLRLRL